MQETGGTSSGPAVIVYLSFAFVVWPTFVPFAIGIVEPDRSRRRIMLACGVLGVAVSAFLAFILFGHDVTAVAERHRILYELAPLHAVFAVGPYLVASVVPCLVSSHRSVNAPGVLATVTAKGSYTSYSQTFVSVWCSQAAVVSAVVLAHFVYEWWHTHEHA